MQQLSLLNDSIDEKRTELYAAQRTLDRQEHLVSVIRRELQSICTHPISSQKRENLCPTSRGRPKITCMSCGKDLTRRILG